MQYFCITNCVIHILPYLIAQLRLSRGVVAYINNKMSKSKERLIIHEQFLIQSNIYFELVLIYLKLFFNQYQFVLSLKVGKI